MIDISIFPFHKLEQIKLVDEDLNIEQLPQILRLMGVNEAYWKVNGILEGVDGTKIKIRGDGNKEYIILTPLEITSNPWSFPTLDPKSITTLIKDLLPCSEGESYVNPSPWDRIEYRNGKWIHMKAGEITDNLKIIDKSKNLEVYQNTVKIATNFYNPVFHFLNPFYVQTSRKPIETSSFVSLESTESIAIVSSSPFDIEFNNGDLNIQGKNELYVLHLEYWNEKNPFKINWDLRNTVIKMDCKSKYNLSLYRIEPSSIVPIYLNYDSNQKILYLSVINMSNEDLISTIYFSARIENVEIDGEDIIPEFDRIRFPIRRWRIKNLKIKLRRLIESYLKRKIIT